jgi:hypothetical protein
MAAQSDIGTTVWCKGVEFRGIQSLGDSRWVAFKEDDPSRVLRVIEEDDPEPAPTETPDQQPT